VLSRVISDFIYKTMKIFFRERKILNQVFSEIQVKPHKFKYIIIGIRPSGIQIADSLRMQSKVFETVGFNGFTDQLPVGIFDENASRIIQGRRMSSGEIGCARSHQLSYQRHLNEDWVIFLEDDVEIIGSVSEIEMTLAGLPSEPTLVMLNYGPTSHVMLPFWSRKAGAYTYALNKSALKIVNNSYSEIWCVADWPIQWIFRLNVKVVGQEVIRLRNDLESAIQEGRIDEKNRINSTKDLKKVFNTDEYKEGNNFQTPSIISLYKLLKEKRLQHSFMTAFLASKSGLYFISQKLSEPIVRKSL